MDQILGPFNFKKVIYSTGFYSPPVIKNEVQIYGQLSMESFAAESRGFKRTKWPKKSKNRPYFHGFAACGCSASLSTGRYNNNNKRDPKIRKKPIKLNLNSYFQLHTFGGRRGRGRKKIKKI